MGVGFAAIVLVPFACNLFFSLFEWKGGLAPFHFVGLGNYEALLHDELFWSSFKNSIYMIVAIVVIPTAIGLVLAALLFDYLGRKFGPRVASFLRATYYLPQIVPVAVAGVIWSWVLGAQSGAINTLLSTVGINGPDWLGNPHLALYSIMIVLIWGQIGYPVVIFMSGLQRVDPELLEAAEVDGAGWWRRFRAITIPQIRPEVFIVILTATVGALKVFAPVLILTGGGPESSTYVPSYYSYLNFFQLSRVGYGSSIATVLTILILIIASLILWWQRVSIERAER
ncbi:MULTISPECIES: carbohydrate ABC transporter permease [unclassified Curtobacterium]|uniref:carbohydrate ABC transporter permease n=1 Tax=unclassified Curtobacterium TaxID=257496 RepID=UPI000DAA0A4B|nr:sugar ABC transporter permease [Curtobacterium sp. MCBD17_028]PZF60445.1 sugar ABC transporter permease [Curtobacterium sp. MCBD17_034]PZF62833.1 sugar ABC transporter permease [Curtobacterium sp. MCBD17_013]PZM35135.1 sugar ABC transporter permease [Curtobacterium sp. MCBD17_031]